MKALHTEAISWLQRATDQKICLAVTGLSRSGKTAFITSLVNQLLNIHNGARLPLFSAVREGRVQGVKRIAQRDLGVASFTYDSGMAQLAGHPPEWPTATRGVSKIELALRFRSQRTMKRYLKPSSTLEIEIIDYPGEWLLDLPMLAQSYEQWSQQMRDLLHNQRGAWAQQWQSACQHLAEEGNLDERLLADLAQAWTDHLHQCKNAGYHFIQPGRFVLPGDLAGAPALQFFPWPFAQIPTAASGNEANFRVLKQRYDYYCQHVVKKFYTDYFLKFDRQIVLVDCLQPLNSGRDAFQDMQLALTQLMQSFHYGQRSLFRRLFSPVIDKLLFAASKADHVTSDQHENMVSLLQQVIKQARDNAAFEGIDTECLALSSIQATQAGYINQQQRIPVLRGRDLNYQPISLYPGEVPARLPTAAFWQKQGFQFANFSPLNRENDQPLAHLRLDNALEFLLGDKLR